MFKLWLSKVHSILRRQLSESEVSTARRLFEERYKPEGAAEYLK